MAVESTLIEVSPLSTIDDVHDGLASYMETVERADELAAKIERTDELIDEVIYELYGLTDEEIEIVEEAIGKWTVRWISANQHKAITTTVVG
jgi:hypothetical protein